MPSLSADRVLWPDGTLRPGELHWQDDRITELVPCAPPGGGTVVAPGFIDLQVNGIDDVDVTEATGADWDILAERLRAQGVTAWCPTLVTMAPDRYGPALQRIAEAMAGRRRGQPEILGVHMEGPFLGGAPGAHPRQHLRPIDQAMIAALPSIVRMMTIGPELDGSAMAVQSMVQRGISVSLGHTTASPHQVSLAADAGATLVTHLFNAMGGLHHRNPGAAAAALLDDRLWVCIIADGTHVAPTMLNLAARLAGRRLVLVTDAIAWRTTTLAGQISLVDGVPRLDDGTLAGTVLTMDRAVRVCTDAGISLVDALHAASTNPAAALGLADRGSLRAGMRADLVVLDDTLRVQRTIIGGR